MCAYSDFASDYSWIYGDEKQDFNLKDLPFWRIFIIFAHSMKK